MGTRKLSDADLKHLERVAALVANQPGAEDFDALLYSQLLYLAESTPSSGGAGSIAWVAGVRAFGEMLVAYAKREEARLRHMKL